MLGRRQFGVTLVGAAVAASAIDARAAAGPVEQAIAVTRVYGDGQKLAAVALEYRRDVVGATLSRSAFDVAGRTITGVHTGTSSDPDDRAAQGRWVILELSPDDRGAGLRVPRKPPGGGAGPGGPRLGGSGPPPAGGGPPPGGFPTPVFKAATATVAQMSPISTVDGGTIPPSAPMRTTAVRNLVADDFRQLTFKDPKTGDTLRYNLFSPRDAVAGRRYPLVLFMHDAGVTGADPLITLRQGRGAIAWASAEDQAKRPCFVLAPQYPTVVVNDQSQATGLLDTTADLVRDLAHRLPIDPDRIYATGQSMGAMMTIAMNIKYPGLFAASYIVAGQWDPALVAPLARDRLWVIVSQGDLKAYPGENAIMKTLEGKGARISRAVWNGRASDQTLSRDAEKLAAAGTPINYVALEKGTVTPPDEPDTGGANHMNTWRIAYDIDGIRAWLFDQKAPNGGAQQ